ncbi:phosphotransferase [Myroides marinus]|uniref:Ser/Thr protein kinase RdoA involved in Cpx stress response, MazF antagonist n=1 Tax=Myroides marinus TaxID=703342 RepID=A0A1H6TD21_9FLAO|nr:phosphotransferase [Myroides marinus]MDM1379001.1 phosphotransferase [Myroides marinus]MDM1386272.1 phosphotransferase [Myroides marinus]MDM1393485.1 phosphotransferase [Myroides marinus]SEI76074.1 Ser/Thr protein kinase RdoA involved in Cpx stress response, MazF antagonist [Myroides marinus]
MTTFPVTASTLSETELGNFIKEKYQLSENCECKLFRTGVNHTYFISDNETKFVCRVYCHNWRTKVEIEQELELLKLLRDSSISISYPISDSSGAFIQDINAPEGIRYAVLFSFAEGEKMRFMSKETCFSIGSLMAKIHNVTENKKIDRVSYDSKILLNNAYQLLIPYFEEGLEEMKYLKEIENKVSKKFEEINGLENSTGIVHLDIWYDNLSVNNENEITIFDFDNCGNGLLVLDVGYFLKQLFFIESDKKEYELKAESFLKGYQKNRSLSDKEIELIPESGASIFMFYLGVQAQRFDWSNIFFTKNYLTMFVGRIKSWLDYYEEKNNCNKPV